MKRIFCLIFAAAMILGSFASCGSKKKPSVTDADSGGTDVPDDGQGAVVDVNVEYPEFNLGSLTLEPFDPVVGRPDGIDSTTFPGDPEKDYRDPKQYTLTDYMADNDNMSFNPVSGRDVDGRVVFGYTLSSLYDWRLNSTGESWSIVPEMAVGFPVDVTSEYVGEYGVEEGDIQKAFKFTLRPDICFEDGTPIDADTYIYSWQQMLDPLQRNKSADTFCSGNFSVFGARDYFWSGRVERLSLSNLGYESLNDFLEDGHTFDELYLDIKGFWNITDENGNGVVKATDETMIRNEAVSEGADEDYVSAKYLFDNYLDRDMPYEKYAKYYLLFDYTHENADWDGVGIKKIGDREFVIIFNNTIPRPEYTIPYNLNDRIVKKDVYEASKKYYDADNKEVDKGSGKAVFAASDYGTSPEKFVGYGPYSLTAFEKGEKIRFERNQNWWGYSDDEHFGMYQADAVDIRIIANYDEALEAFLAGEIDSIMLRDEDVETYGSSNRVFFTPEAYTTKLTFNSDIKSLRERGTAILDNYNFRKAFALAIDRASFAEKCVPGSLVEFGLLNGMYVYDPYNNMPYRESDPAKKAIVDLFGLTYGDGGEYADLDEAYGAVTGFDLEEARRLMQVAYEQCVSAGTYEEGAKVEIEMCIYKSTDFYVGMFNFIKDALEAACVGTGFEGNVTLKMTADEDYYDKMYSGKTDVIFSTWGGDSDDPFSVLYYCYCDGADGSGRQMEYGFDTTRVRVRMTINGHEFTETLNTWAKWCEDTDPNLTIRSNDGEIKLDRFSNYTAESKCAVYANLEYVYLSNWDAVSLYSGTEAALLSRRVEYGTTVFNNKTGFGGVRYMTFNYDDAEWEAVRADVSYTEN